MCKTGWNQWGKKGSSFSALCQCREEGAYALENASESREVEPISSDLRSEATEEEGIGSTSRDEDAFSSVQKHPPHGINIVIRKMNCCEMRDHISSNSDALINASELL